MTSHLFAQALSQANQSPILIRKGPHGFSTELLYKSRREAEDAVQTLKPYETSFSLGEASHGAQKVWALRFVTLRVRV